MARFPRRIGPKEDAVFATIHSNDRTGLLAAALVADGLTAAGTRPTVIAVGANGAQACGLARLSGSFDLLRPDPCDAVGVLSGLAARPAGDVVAVLPTDLLREDGPRGPGHLRVVATACRLTAAQALHATASGAWHLRCDSELGQPAWRIAPRVLPLRLPNLSPLEQMRLLAGELDNGMRYAAVALAATLLAVSADPDAERFEAGDLTALMSPLYPAGDRVLHERLLDCAAALGDPVLRRAPADAAKAGGGPVRKARPTPVATARLRATQPARLRA
jgi:hypothetical protein